MPRESASRYADFSRLLTFHEPVLSTPTSQDYFKPEVKPSLGQRLVLVNILLCLPSPSVYTLALEVESLQPSALWGLASGCPHPLINDGV